MRTWIANAVTISRLGFFAAFIWQLQAGNSWEAIVLFAIAWGLDAIDGTIARSLGTASTLGSQLDKAVDRIIIIGSVMFLLRYGYLPHAAIFLLVKDIGLSMALNAKPSGNPYPSAGTLGKITSVLQGLGILWLFFGLPGQIFVVTSIALLGGYVAVDYLKKL